MMEHFPVEMETPCFGCGGNKFNTVVFTNRGNAIPEIPPDQSIHLDCYVKLLVEKHLINLLNMQPREERKDLG